LSITIKNELGKDVEIQNEMKLLEYLSSKFEVKNISLTVKITKSEIPIGAGLGSSAAYAACLSAAICLACMKLRSQEHQETIEDHIYDGTNFLERINHGKPSGVDATTILTGGTISYALKHPPEITQVEKLKCNIDSLNMFIVFTGKQRDTKQLVTKVTQLKTEHPDEFNELINTISNVASELIELV